MYETSSPNQQSSPPRISTLFVGIVVLCIAGIASALIWYHQQPTILPPQSGGGGTLPPPSADVREPSIPSHVAVTPVSGTEVRISWGASTDDVGVVGYRVYRDGTLVGTSNITIYTDKSARPASEYTYVVTAFDAARHESLASADIRIQTPIGNEPPPIPHDDTISINTRGGDLITVKNFYTNAKEITNDDVIIRDNNYYTLIFFPAESSFLITLNDSDIHTARGVLELEIGDILGMEQQNLCRLAVFINIPFDINEAYSKKSYGLSFCPGENSF